MSNKATPRPAHWAWQKYPMQIYSEFLCFLACAVNRNMQCVLEPLRKNIEPGELLEFQVILTNLNPEKELNITNDG